MISLRNRRGSGDLRYWQMISMVVVLDREVVKSVGYAVGMSAYISK